MDYHPLLQHPMVNFLPLNIPTIAGMPNGQSLDDVDPLAGEGTRKNDAERSGLSIININKLIQVLHSVLFCYRLNKSCHNYYESFK
jgi:hypothetical protein